MIYVIFHFAPLTGRLFHRSRKAKNMCGRKPKPIERQIAEGDPSKHGAGKLQERLERQIKPAGGGLPAAPKHLTGRARSMWLIWSRELAGMGLDFNCDRVMLEGACMSYSRAIDAEIEIKRHGAFFDEPIVNDEGIEIGVKIRKHPAVEIANESWRLCRSFCSEFGLSPVSRTRLTLDKKEVQSDEDELAKLFAAPRPLRPRRIQ